MTHFSFPLKIDRTEKFALGRVEIFDQSGDTVIIVLPAKDQKETLAMADSICQHLNGFHHE